MHYYVNYSAKAISESLCQYSTLHFGISQQSHPDSSSDEESCSKFSSNGFHFEEIQTSFEECNMRMFLEANTSYFALKDYFKTLCKLLDGEKESIRRWKEKIQDGIAETTKKLCGDVGSSDMENYSSFSSAVYVPAYKGQRGLKKRKWRKGLKTREYK
eukprot:13461353-Ditylum_brightwellii.AAC.1